MGSGSWLVRIRGAFGNSCYGTQSVQRWPWLVWGSVPVTLGQGSTPVHWTQAADKCYSSLNVDLTPPRCPGGPGSHTEGTSLGQCFSEMFWVPAPSSTLECLAPPTALRAERVSITAGGCPYSPGSSSYVRLQWYELFSKLSSRVEWKF